MAAKPNTTSRLFGNAMAGVKKPQLKLVSKATDSKAATVATALAKNGSANGSNGVRGRGTMVFTRTPKKASGPVRRQKIVRRSVPYNGAEADAFAHRQQQMPRPDPHKEADWHHDQYTGPLPIGSSVFVRNLPKGANATTVSSLFSSLGEVVSVQMDDGPLPTATIGFVRQDTAFNAVERFHGFWLRGEQLKVSVRESSALQACSTEDDDFWRHELRQMPRRESQQKNNPIHARTSLAPSVRGRGSVDGSDDDFWRRELAEMKMQRRQSFDPPARARNAADDDDDFWRHELAEMRARKRQTGSMKIGGSVERQRRGRGSFVADSLHS